MRDRGLHHKKKKTEEGSSSSNPYKAEDASVQDLLENVLYNKLVSFSSCKDLMSLCYTNKSQLENCRAQRYQVRILGEYRFFNFDEYEFYCKFTEQCKTNFFNF